MLRDESLYLADIQDCCEKVLKYTAGYTLKDLIRETAHLTRSCVTLKLSVKLPGTFRMKPKHVIHRSNGVRLAISAGE